MSARVRPLLFGLLGVALLVAGGVGVALLPPPTARDTPPTASSVPPPRVAFAPDALDRLTRSTVFIEVDGGQGGSGSGWFGGEPGLVVTNAHVINMKSPGANPPAKIGVFTHAGRRYEGAKVKVLAVDRENDLAVLRIVNEPDLPPPLPVRPAAGLRPLDPLVCLGFPGGRRPSERNGRTGPPAVSVTSAVVSALRTDDAGTLRSVQVQGGIVHGNSGGPVADADGSVVGVAARVDTDHLGRLTNLAEAVPGEAVAGLLGGRATEVEVGQGYFRGDRVTFPITVRCADPLDRLTAVGVAVWLADDGPPRPAGDDHSAATGDVDDRNIPLTYSRAAKVATGEIDFPKDTGGRVYWLRPYHSNTLTPKRYLAGTPLPAADPPVERTPADLARRPPDKAAFTLTVTHEAEVSERRGEGGAERWERQQVGQEVRFKELVVEGGVEWTLAALTPRAGPPDRPTALPKAVAGARQALTAWVGGAAVNDDGTAGAVKSAPTADAGMRDPADRLGTQLADTAAEGFVKLPGKSVNAGDTWTDTLTRRLKACPDHLLADPSNPVAREVRTYTYLGRRERGGRAEAVLKVDGVLTAGGATCGGVSGRAVIDPATGLVLDASYRRTFEVDGKVNGEAVRWSGTEVVKISREK